MPLYFPRSQKKLVVMILAAIAVVSLIFVTWAMARVSAWIVYHDPVWMQMEKEGAGLEHALAEVFLAAKDWLFFTVEMVCCVTFLGLLWHTLYRDERKKDSSKDAAEQTGCTEPRDAVSVSNQESPARDR